MGSGQPFESIPTDRRETAQAAATAAFGAGTVDTIQPVAGGASGALTYRVEAGGRPYLLRIETRPGSHGNPQRGYAAMRIAAEAGIAPPLRHADAEAGVAIMDFIAQKPLDQYPGGPPALVRELGAMIGRLQAAPLFPSLVDYAVMIQGMLAVVRGSGGVAPGLLDRHTEGFERLREAYPWGASAPVSSHNDPNPLNILYDGERLWLIDWETAFRNDPMADIAILADNFAGTPELADSLMAAWLGRAPDAMDRARLTLMRPMTRLYYACLIFMLFAGGGAPIADLSAPTVAEFRQAFAEGKLVMGAPETVLTLGKMQLAGFLAAFAAPGFDDALAIVRAG